MEEKKFSKFELATIKRTAQNVNHMVTRKNKIMEKIEELSSEFKSITEAQEQFEAPIRTITGGYSSEDLIDKVVETTDNVDKNGNPVKVTKWVFKYPDTIIPPVMEEVKEEELDDSTNPFTEPHKEVNL